MVLIPPVAQLIPVTQHAEMNTLASSPLVRPKQNETRRLVNRAGTAARAPAPAPAARKESEAESASTTASEGERAKAAAQQPQPASPEVEAAKARAEERELDRLLFPGGLQATAPPSEPSAAAPPGPEPRANMRTGGKRIANMALRKPSKSEPGPTA